METEEKKIRIVYLHGMGGSPRGDKVRYLSKYFNVYAPQLVPEKPFLCLRLAVSAIQEFHPHVLVGSSYGGAILTWLIQHGEWNGPSVLLAPALGVNLPYSIWLPRGTPAVVVHGTWDDVVPVEHSQKLVASGKVQGSPFPELVTVPDQHTLRSLLKEESSEGVPSLRDVVAGVIVRALGKNNGNGSASSSSSSNSGSSGEEKDEESDGPYSVELAEEVVANVDPRSLACDGSWAVWSQVSLGFHALWEIPLSYIVEKAKRK